MQENEKKNDNVPMSINELPPGTCFYVINGAWYGKIIARDGERYVLAYDAAPEFSSRKPVSRIRIDPDHKMDDLSISDIRLPKKSAEFAWTVFNHGSPHRYDVLTIQDSDKSKFDVTVVMKHIPNGACNVCVQDDTGNILFREWFNASSFEDARFKGLEVTRRRMADIAEAAKRRHAVVTEALEVLFGIETD